MNLAQRLSGMLFGERPIEDGFRFHTTTSGLRAITTPKGYQYIEQNPYKKWGILAQRGHKIAWCFNPHGGGYQGGGLLDGEYVQNLNRALSSLIALKTIVSVQKQEECSNA